MRTPLTDRDIADTVRSAIRAHVAATALLSTALYMVHATMRSLCDYACPLPVELELVSGGKVFGNSAPNHGSGRLRQKPWVQRARTHSQPLPPSRWTRTQLRADDQSVSVSNALSQAGTGARNSEWPAAISSERRFCKDGRRRCQNILRSSSSCPESTCSGQLSSCVPSSIAIIPSEATARSSTSRCCSSAQIRRQHRPYAI